MIIEVVLGMVLWGFLSRELRVAVGSEVALAREEGRELRGKSGLFLLLWGGLVFLFLLSRVYPFFLSEYPLGYDTGIYRYELWHSVQALPEYVSGLFLGLPLISDVFFLFGVSSDDFLSVFYVLLGVLLPLSVALFAVQHWGRRTALMVLFLFAVSIIQWKAYSMILMKQMLSLSLVFFSLWLVEKRSFWVLLVLVFIALLQPLDLVFVALALFFFGLWLMFFRRSDKADFRYFLWLFLFGLAGLVVVILADPMYWSGLWSTFFTGLFHLGSVEQSLQEGVFLSLADYGYQSVFFVVFGVLGVFLELRQRRMSLPLLYLFFLVVWITLRMFFFQRLLIPCDAILIFFAGFALLRFWDIFKVDRIGKILCSLLFLGLIIPFCFELARFQPLISQGEIDDMSSFCDSLPSNTMVFATDAYYAPWIRGSCLSQRVVGPGLFENAWSRSDWEAFWLGDSARVQSLLKNYSGELYFYQGLRQRSIPFDPELFEQVDERWVRSLEFGVG
ncbi:MAG: hypothetical protein U1C97_00835 [Candidatus Gracilibacteria bacterium]|nr:hypothetical protein [Candidatus Gracilibacteria bacterium]